MDGAVVKGIHFKELRNAGSPPTLAKMYEVQGADEVVFLDVGASPEGRRTMVETVRMTAEEVFIPLTVGGGIKGLDDIATILKAGADKVSINTAAVKNPEVVRMSADRFGSQCIVVAIDAKRIESKRWEVYVMGGREPTGLDAVEWARRVEALGAGEILMTSIDADGTQIGYDIELTRTIADAINIPVIASGGAGSPQHIYTVLTVGKADAALAASIFHYERYRVKDIKEYLSERGVPVRLECDSYL